MVQTACYSVFYMLEIHHHTVAVKLLGAAEYGHYRIVSVQMGAFAFIIQTEPVSKSYFYAFGNVVHILYICGYILKSYKLKENC